jgi:hypothetical protein
MSTEKKGKYIFPVRHSHTIKDGDINYWSNTKDTTGKSFVEMFGIPKVILIKGLYPYPYNDYKGEYGMSQICYGLKLLSEPLNFKRTYEDLIKIYNEFQQHNFNIDQDVQN